MLQTSDTIFKVWLIDPQRARWLWVVPVVVVAGTLACSIGFALAGQPLLGVLLGAGLSLGVAVWYGRWMLVPATVQVSSRQLTLVPTEASRQREILPFEQLAYCTYTTYRAHMLQLFRIDGPRIRLRARGGTADLDALAALVKKRLTGQHPYR